MKINMNRSTIYELALILGIGLLSLTWFRGLLINTSDFVLPLDREKYFIATLSWWDDRYSTGVSNPLQFPNLLFGMFSAFTQYLHIPLLYYEMFIFYIWFAGSGISAYIFCKVLNLGRITRISTSVFYMLNPFALVLVWSIGQGMIQIEYTLLPAIVGLYIYGLIKNKGISYGLSLQLLWFALGFFGTSANVQLTIVYWVAIFLVYITYSIYKLIKLDLANLIKGTKFTIISIVSFFALNVYWLLPALSQMGQYFNYYSGVANVAFIPNLDAYRLNSVKLVDAIRLMGYWAFQGGWEAGQYYPWAQVYENAIMIFISFLTPLIVILGIRKSRGWSLLLIPLYLVGLFLIKGVNPPLGWLNEYVFINFSMFQTTRNVIVTWGLLVTFCTSALFGIGISSIYDKICSINRNSIIIRRISGIFIFSILFLVIGVLVFPFWTGDVIHGPSANFTSVDVRFEVPNYYYEFKDFIESEKGDFRILTLPLHKAGNGFYNFSHGFIGPEPILWFSNRPVIYLNTLSPMHDLLANIFGKNPIDKDKISDILSMLNIRYIVLHDDAEWRLIKSYAPQFYYADEEIIRNMLNASNIQFERQIGKLVIYKNMNEGKHIYSPSNLVYLDDKFETIRDILPSGLIDKNSIIIDGDQKLNNSRFENDARIQVRKFDNKGIKFFAPDNLSSNIFFDSSELLNQIKLDKKIFNLDFANRTNFVNSENVSNWSADETAKDSIEDYIDIETSQRIATWNIDLSILSDRNINFKLNPINLTINHNIEITMDGDGSSNGITFQLYDSDGNHIGWNRKINFNGTEKIVLSLISYDFQSSYPSTVKFSFSKVNQLSIYYYNKNQKEEFSKLVFRSIEALRPSVNRWSGIQNISLLGGWHNIEPIDGKAFGKVMITTSNELYSPNISFSKLSSNEYNVNVINATHPYYLIFSESFDQGWKVYDKSLPTFKMFLSPIISEKDHLQVNGFANAWYINKTGTYSLTLYFHPQSFYEITLSFTFISGVLMILIITWKNNSLKGIFQFIRRRDVG